MIINNSNQFIAIPFYNFTDNLNQKAFGFGITLNFLLNPPCERNYIFQRFHVCIRASL